MGDYCKLHNMSVKGLLMMHKNKELMADHLS